MGNRRGDLADWLAPFVAALGHKTRETSAREFCASCRQTRPASSTPFSTPFPDFNVSTISGAHSHPPVHAGRAVIPGAYCFPNLGWAEKGNTKATAVKVPLIRKSHFGEFSQMKN